jgi:hypothetical protein
MSLAKRVGGAMVGAALAACARGIDMPLDLEVGGAAGEGGFPAVGVGGNGVGGSPGASGGAGPSVGAGATGPVGSGGVGGASATTVGVGGSGTGGSPAGGSGGADVDASTGGSAGAGGQGGAPIDASSVDVVDASGPKDAPPDVPCPGAGTALSFDGSKSQYVVIPGTAMPSGAAPRTIEIWVLNKSPIANWAPDHTVWEHAGGGNLATFAMDFDNVGSPSRMELYVNPSANSFFFDTGMMQDKWFHLAGTFDGTKTHAFVNGVEIGTGFTITGTLATPANQPFYLGSAKLRSYFTGSIDEVRVWNVARTQAEIARDMSFRLVGNEPGLVGYYRFDEGTGAAAKDATSGGNDGTLTNGPTYVASGVKLGCR